MRSSALTLIACLAACAAPLVAQSPSAQTAAPAQNATPPGTDIFLVQAGKDLASLPTARPVPVAVGPGYDNQPAFTPDGQAILFSSARNGAATDIWRFDRGTGAARVVRATPDAEYSPLQVPDGGGYSVIRVEADGTQRLWRYDWSGGDPRVLLEGVKPVGYQAWIDDDLVALFILGQPSTLQVASLKTGKAEIRASAIGRSIHRVPGARAVGFVHRVSDTEYWISRLEVDTGKIDRLVRLREGNTERDIAWTPDGAVLQSAGTKIYRWRADAQDWTEIFDAAAHGLGAVTRLAVSPAGDALAIVVNERR